MRRESHLKIRYQRLNPRFFIVLFVIAAIFPECTYAGKEKETLFPEREYIKNQSELFFKNVDTRHPVIEKVDFFTSSEAYLSAYLNLTVYIAKNNYLKEILPLFAEENRISIETFKASLEKLKIGNYPGIQKELNISGLKFYLAVLHALNNDYQSNELSGNRAFTLWNILLAVTERAYRQKEKTAENAAILTVSSHLVFFKQHKKWRKKAKKILGKTKPDTIKDKDIKLVLRDKVLKEL